MKHIVFVESNGFGLLALKTAKELGYYVTFIRSKYFAHFYETKQEFKEINSIVDNCISFNEITDEEKLYDIMYQINKKKEIHYIITVLEYVVLQVARVAQSLKIPFTNAKAVELARNKSLMRKRLAEYHIPSTRFLKANNLNDLLSDLNKIEYPVIMKPNSGAASWFVKKIYSKDELIKSYKSYLVYLKEIEPIYRTIIDKSVIIEEYLVGDMVSLELAAANGNFYPLAVCDRARDKTDETLEIGSTMPSELASEKIKEINTYGIEVVKALGLNIGIFHLEIMLTAKGPILIEANPRLMGGGGPRLLSLALDKNIYEILIDIHVGTNLDCIDS